MIPKSLIFGRYLARIWHGRALLGGVQPIPSPSGTILRRIRHLFLVRVVPYVALNFSAQIELCFAHGF
ncbi:MAG: hypothetical protein DMG69_07970 [Acidobacteria bacterium]|nr:MAG: hypothetical protein DMG69_07970 [Acidobacteriota bacterium]